VIPIPVGRARVSAATGGLVACAGGALILVQDLFFGVSGTLFVAGFLLGAAIIALGGMARSQLRHREGIGIAAALLGVVSIFLVNGFFLGAFLAIAGGTVILSTGMPTGGVASASLYSRNALGPPCPKCGRPIPTWTSRCPYCGFP
jgi:Family of unknown function (DUF6114)